MLKKCSSNQLVRLPHVFWGETEPCYLAQACLELKLLLSDACVRVCVFILMFSLLLCVVTVCVRVCACVYSNVLITTVCSHCVCACVIHVLIWWNTAWYHGPEMHLWQAPPFQHCFKQTKPRACFQRIFSLVGGGGHLFIVLIF